MTDKEKLEKVKAEIKRVKKNQEGVFTEYTDGKFDLCEHLLSFIDSLQEEPVSEELDEAALMHFKDVMEYEIKTGHKMANMTSFKAGANWQKEQDQSTIELAEDHAMLAGMEKMKEEMMAKAIEVTVHIDAGGYPYIPQIELYDYDKDVPLAKDGDKYKVILIKEE